MTYRQVESERAGRDSDGPIIPPYASYQRFVQGLRQGHNTAWIGLDNHYHKLAFSLAAHIVGFDDAGDAVNTGFFKLYKKFTSKNPPDDRVEKEAGLVALMCTIVHNEGVDMYRGRERRRSRFVEIPLDDYLNSGREEPESNDGNPEEIVLKQMEQVRKAEIVRAALVQLPPSQRQALTAYYYGSHTQTEVARALEEPLGTAKTRIRLGHEKLRGLLTPQSLE